MNQLITQTNRVTISFGNMHFRYNPTGVATLDPDWHDCVVQVAIQGEQPVCTILITETSAYIGLE